MHIGMYARGRDQRADTLYLVALYDLNSTFDHLALKVCNVLCVYVSVYLCVCVCVCASLTDVSGMSARATVLLISCVPGVCV